MRYFLEQREREPGSEWFRPFSKPDYLSEWRDYVQKSHYAALADIREFGIDTHSDYRAVSEDGKEIITLW